MKVKCLIFLLVIPFLHGCSWIVRFFVVNHSASPIHIETKLKKDPASFPIFHYNELYTYSCPGKIPDWNGQKEIKPDTLENYSHYTIDLAANTALEIGRLQNDKYQKHDQHFINGRTFNFDTLIITKSGKKVLIAATTFDDYFRKGKNGELFYYFK